MRKTHTITVVATVLLALAGVFAPPGAAGTPPEGDHRDAAAPAVPFAGSLEGTHTSRTPVAPPVFFDRFDAQGEASHLGRFWVVITATVDLGARPVTGTGTYTFVAADGDRLVAEHTGSSALVRPGTVLITEHATIDPVRSSGRFAGARGSFTVERLADAATGVGGVTRGTIEGSISLATRSRR